MKKEVPARLFLIVAYMLTGLEVEQSSFDKFMEAAHRDHISSHLQKVIEQNNKLCFVLTVRWKRWMKH